MINLHNNLGENTIMGRRKGLKIVTNIRMIDKINVNIRN